MISIEEIIEGNKEKMAVVEERIELLQRYLEIPHGDTVEDGLDRNRIKRELINLNDELKSMLLYNKEYEKDIKMQEAQRKFQLEQVRDNIKPMLELAKRHINKNKKLDEQTKARLKALRNKFIQKDFINDGEKINLFREMGKTLTNLSKK
jgi:Na+/phosphate symporter